MKFNLINRNPGFISSEWLNDYDPGEHEFISNDTRELFDESLKRNSKDWYYRNHEVKYILNSEKFRTKEFRDIDWKNSIVLIGCSCTFGIGVTEEDTIAANLQEITGKNVVNLGQPGASNSMIAYNSLHLKQNYPEPLAVVNLWTSMTRYFVMTESFDLVNFVDDVDKRSNRTVTSATYNIMFMKMANEIWKDHPNYIQTCANDIEAENDKYTTRFKYSITRKLFPEALYVEDCFWSDVNARDSGHPGRKATKKLAKIIASNLKL